MIRIVLTGVHVDDQEKAERFYVEKLGFEKRTDFPVDGARWLTMVAPGGPEDVELVLEPNAEPARSYQEALYTAGIPVTSFGTDDIQADYQQLTARGVRFIEEPTRTGQVTQAVFDDTCGNLIMLTQLHAE